jgi:hypothetical protein
LRDPVFLPIWAKRPENGAMSLEDKWEKAKKACDRAQKENAKAVTKLQKEYDALYKAAEKIYKKLKLKQKLDHYVEDAALVRNEAPELAKISEHLRAKRHEINRTRKLPERKTFGAEPAFREVDNVLNVGAKLRAAGLQDAGKWQKWVDMAVKALKKVAAAEKKFNAWMPPSHSQSEDQRIFLEDFESIQKKMSSEGTPLLKHARAIING